MSFRYNQPSFKVTHSLFNNYKHHHIHPYAPAFFAKRGKLDAIVPLVQGKTKSKAGMPLREEIIIWFLSLSKEDFISATAIENANFIELFFKKYEKQQNKLIHLSSQRTILNSSPIQFKKTSTIYTWIRYAATSDPLMYLDECKATPQAVLDWLDQCSNYKVFQLPMRSINKQNPEQNLLWFNSNSFHQLDQWLANQFQKTIMKFYFSRKDRLRTIKKLRKYMQEKGVSRDILNLTKILLSNIAEGIIEKNEKQINSLRIFEDKLKLDNQLKLLDLKEDIPHRKRGKNRYNISKSQQCISISQKQSEKVCNNSPVLQEKENLSKKYTFIQNTHISSQNTYQDSNILICTRSVAKQQNFSPEINSPIKSISKSSQKTCSCQQGSEQQVQKSHKEFVGEIFQQLEQKDDDNDDETLTEGHFGQQKKRRRKRKNNKNTNKIIQDFKNRVTHSLLNKQLDTFLDTLSKQSNSNYESKVVAFERVRYFVKSIYPYADASLFGSNAVGLSLPTSDIDLMLVGLSVGNREELWDYLAHIGVFINEMGWVISCSSYKNARVPLLKLQIDTSVNYLTPKIKLAYHQPFDLHQLSYLNLKDPSRGKIVKVDITVSIDNEGLSPSTELMRNWLQEKPTIQRVLLALKYTLAVRGYCENFKGGIGSYCLFIMVASYFQHFNQQREQSDCQILLDILNFYGEQFENHLKIIILATKQSCYLTNQQALNRFQLTEQLIFGNALKILDPLNNKLMSSSCYQYSYIKTQWRKIKAKIMNISEKVQAEISAYFANTSEIIKLMLNNRAFDKWVNRLQGRIDLSVGNILQGKF